MQKPVLNSLIKIRMSNNTFYHILKNNFLNSFLLSSLIFFLFITSGIIVGMKLILSYNLIRMLIRLYLFIFCCSFCCYAIYFFTNKPTLSILSVLMINYGVLVTIYAVDFCLITNTMDDKTINIIFIIYNTIIGIFSVAYTYKGAMKKECYD